MHLIDQKGEYKTFMMLKPHYAALMFLWNSDPYRPYSEQRHDRYESEAV